MLKDTDGGLFKKGTTGWMRKEEARLLIENGFAEYVEQKVIKTNTVEVQVHKINTSPTEFTTFLNTLPHTPTLIPIIANGKRPDIPAGESWKNPTHHLTPEQALNRIQTGKNVGVVANDWLVIVDLDNPEKFKLNIKTLTVETRNGRLHMYYKNAGDIENAVGKNGLAKCGEVRAEWQYVLAPGSYVPTDNDKTEHGTGLYHIIDPTPITELKRSDLPEDFIPTAETAPVNPEILNTQYTNRNKHGWGLEDIRKRDKKLDDLLNNNLAGLPSPSEADMSTLTKLLFWDYTEGEAVAILKKYRYRPKLDRDNYITNMLGHISRNKTISSQIDAKTWTPTTGYMIELKFDDKQQHVTTNSKDLTALIIEAFKTQYIFKTPTDTEELHYYKNGIYTPAEHKIKKEIEAELGAKIKTHQVNEVLEHLKWNSYIDREEFNKYNGYTPLQNGLLNLEKLELTDFTPNQIFTFKLPVAYKKDADCPQFKKWLSEVQTPDNITILQEYAGYSLLPKMPFHKSIWFIGEGRNGKGTFIHTLEGIIGKNNISNVSIQELTGERNFAEYQLYGKLINISSEPTTKRDLETPLFKKLTGDDTIAAEVKCKQNRVVFNNFAKFYILGNKYPRVKDNTIAFKERLILVKWEKTFLEGQGQIQHIEKLWLSNPEEKSGILNWMLEGLHRLITNGKFSMTKTQEEMMLELERYSNSPAAWIHERIIFDKEKFVEREKALQDYTEYCDYYNILEVEKNAFYAKLRNENKIQDRKTTILGKSVRIWKGITLKPKLEPDDEENEAQQKLKVADEADKAAKNNCNNNLKNKKINQLENPALCALSALKQQNETKNTDILGSIAEVRVCGNCVNFLKPSCQFPGDFERVDADSGWAYSCRGFVLAGDKGVLPREGTD